MKIKVVIKIATSEKDANKAAVKTLEAALAKLKQGFSEGVVETEGTSARFSIGVDQ